MDAINIIFDGPPGPEAGRFVEVETDAGRSINVGEWKKRSDGLWALRIVKDNIDKRIGLEALLTIRAGYEAENTHRLNCGLSIAYAADAFIELAEQIRALKANPAAESQAA